MDIPRLLGAFSPAETDKLVDALPLEALLGSLERRRVTPSFELLTGIIHVLPDDLLEAELIDREQAADRPRAIESEPATLDEFRARFKFHQAAVKRTEDHRNQAVAARNRTVLAASAILTRREIAAAMGISAARVQQIVSEAEEASGKL
jgi:hypothetical protein